MAYKIKKPKQKEIVIPVYYAIIGKKAVIDEESMRDEFEEKLEQVK